MQKNQKNPEFSRKILNVLAQKHQNTIPPKKLCRSILWLYVALTLYKKSEKSHVSVWQET